MRKAHKLKGVKKTETPQNFFIFDTEGFIHFDEKGEQVHTLRLGVVRFYRLRAGGEKHTEKTLVFFSKEEFWSFVFQNIRPKSAFWFFAHGLDYDAPMVKMWETLTSLGWKLYNYYDKRKAYYWFWRRGNIRLKFVCTKNIFEGGIEELGESIGLKKLKVDFHTVSDAELINYCRRDVDILSEVMLNWIRFIKDNDLGNFKFTIAAQSFTTYRKRYMKHPIYIHAHEKAMKLERAGYFGGRNECFYIGRFEGFPLYAVDVVSMYPSVMRGGLYPYILEEFAEDISPTSLRSRLQRELAMARVVLRVEEPLFPVFFKNKLFFPVGEFETVLSTPELLLAFERADILKVKECAFYKGAVIFKEFVDAFFNERCKARLKGDILNAYFYKLFMNSLYGKFGQKTPKWEKIGEYKPGSQPDMYIPVRWGDKIITHRCFAGIMEESVEQTDAYNAFVAIAAHVTSYARVKLLMYIEAAGWENVYYVDTDCLHVNEEGKRRLAPFIQSGVLGMLEEQAETTQAQYWGLKDYVFGGKTKIKGIRRDAICIDQNTYEQDKWLRFASRCMRGNIEEIRIVREKKRLSRVYTKAKLIRGGGRLSPFRLPNDEGLILELIKQATSS